MSKKNEDSAKPRKVFEDFHDDIPFWIAVADGVLRYCEEGYYDSEGRIFDPMGFYIGERTWSIGEYSERTVCNACCSFAWHKKIFMLQLITY